MYVTNINGTSDHTCSCGSWLKHWENFNLFRGLFKQKKPTYCPACKRQNVELVGAHVQKHESDDNSWYIVPLCNSCNQKSSDEILDIGDCALAPANKALTCDR